MGQDRARRELADQIRSLGSFEIDSACPAQESVTVRTARLAAVLVADIENEIPLSRVGNRGRRLGDAWQQDLSRRWSVPVNGRRACP